MDIRIRLSRPLRQTLIERLGMAYRSGQLRLYRRIQAVLSIVDGKTVTEVAEVLQLAEQTVRNYVHAFILQAADSLRYQPGPGRPPRLTKTQRKELTALITAGPEAAGFTSACWTTPLVAELVYQRFGIAYHPHYLAQLLHELGFSYQKARFISDHLDATARAEWLATTWPTLLRQAQAQGALILFGDEASFAQWGSLSYTWALKGQQPTVKTCGKRKGYKVFGLIDYFSGRLFWKGQAERFNADSYQAFLTEVLAQIPQPIILIQDGARYHTSQAMREFFAAHADRLTLYQLPAYSPDFNPIECLWKKVKKQATHLKYFETFAALTDQVEQTLHQFADLPAEILALMGRYCHSLGAEA